MLRVKTMEIFNFKQGLAQVAAVQLPIRCPGCRELTRFDPVGVSDIQTTLLLKNNPTVLLFGQRVCPNPQYKTHLFVIHRNGPPVIASYPPARIDFDTTGLPPAVIAAFDEAITCHAANCYKASAMMVRKTLEELCTDRGTTGSDLKAKIKDLGTKIVIPADLLDGIDDLRLLGNDAAHVESKHYDDIGQDEVEVAIEFTKEVLKAVYQYAHLLSKLRSLKK